MWWKVWSLSFCFFVLFGSSIKTQLIWDLFVHPILLLSQMFLSDSVFLQIYSTCGQWCLGINDFSGKKCGPCLLFLHGVQKFHKTLITLRFICAVNSSPLTDVFKSLSFFYKAILPGQMIFGHQSLKRFLSLLLVVEFSMTLQVQWVWQNS